MIYLDFHPLPNSRSFEVLAQTRGLHLFSILGYELFKLAPIARLA
jgi:hypothetical protein